MTWHSGNCLGRLIFPRKSFSAASWPVLGRLGIPHVKAIQQDNTLIIAIGLPFYILITYAIAVRRHFAGWTSTILSAFVLTLSQILLSEVLLGFAHVLRPTPLTLINILIPTSLLVFKSENIPGIWLDFRVQLRRSFSFLLRSPLSLGIALSMLIMLSWTLWLIWILPESSYDGLAYHLPVALTRLDLSNMSRLSGWPPWINSYPEYSELLMLWTIIFDNDLTLVDGVQWPFWIMGIVATYALARKLQCKPFAALQGSIVFGTAATIVLQSRVAYNDVMVATLFLIALDVLLAKGGRLSALIAGLATSIIAGIKYSGILYPAFVGLGLFLLSHKDKAPGEQHRVDWCSILIFLAPVLTMATPWYVGNWIAYGNPFWPFTQNIQGRLLFKGLFSLDWLYRNNLLAKYKEFPDVILRLYLWLEPTSRYSHDGRYGGLGMLWLVLGIPSIVFSLLTARGTLRRSLLWILAVAGGIYLMTPYNWWPRYVLFLPGLGAIGVAWVLQHASTWTRRLTQGVLVFGVSFAMLTTIAGSSLSPDTIVDHAHLPAFARPTLGLLDWPAYRWWNNNSYSGSTVAYGYGLYFIAPLWGNDIRNRVVYASNSEEELMAAIDENDVEFLFVERQPENAWIDSVPGFTKLYYDERFSIFQIAPIGP